MAAESLRSEQGQSLPLSLEFGTLGVVGSAVRPESEADAMTVRLGAFLQTVDAATEIDKRDEALERAAAAVAPDALALALSVLATNSSPSAQDLCQLLVRRWVELAPAAAAGWASQLPPGALSSAALGQAAIAWGDSHPQAAAQWVQSLPEGAGRQSAVLGFAYEAARTDPVSALTLTAGLTPSPERDNALVHAASQWAATDPAAVAAWVREVPDDPLRERLLEAVAVAVAAQDAPAAATMAASALPPGGEQDRTAVAIVQRWAQTEPEAAAAWVAQFPDTPAKAAAETYLLESKQAR